MADASVYVMEHIDFADTYEGSPVVPGTPEAAPRHIRTCHINIGSGKETTIAELAALVQRTIAYRGEIKWDASKPDGTMRKLTDVSRLHALGWHHSMEIEDGVRTLYEWYQTN